jgi:phosphoglycolate phosphatase-like HAD superfamily hydrolase
MALDAVIFDSDGTIFDSSVIKKVYKDMRDFFNSKYKSQFGEESEEYIFSRSLARKEIHDTGVSWQETCKRLGILQKDFKYTGAMFLLFQRIYGNEIKPFDGIEEVLRYCRFESKESYGKEIGCYILSTNNVTHIQGLLKKFALDSYFDWPKEIFPSHNSSFPKEDERKPNPAPINRLVAKKGYDKNKLVYVGDMVVDALTCQNAGIKMIHVGWGTNDKDTILENVDPAFASQITFLDSLKDLYYLIKRLNEEQ